MTIVPLLLASLVAGLAVATRAARIAGRRSSAYRRLRSGPGRPAADPVAPLVAEGRRAKGGGGGWVPPAWLAEPPAPVREAIARADVPFDPDTAWQTWISAALLLPTAAWTVSGTAAALLVAMATGAGPPVVLRARRGRSDARLEANLPEAMEAVARSLRSGSSVLQAIEEAGACTTGALGDELGAVAARARNGVSLVDALDGLSARRPLGGVRLAVSALCLGAETGGAQAQAIDGVAATVRDRLGLAAEVRALSSQARASATVMGLAPIGFGAFAAATDPRTSTFLFHTSLGLALVVAGLFLDGVGWLWMQRLSRVGA